MAHNPKTPTRRLRSRSETKTPLTPSLTVGLNAVSLASPTKSRFPKTADVSNPFMSRPASRPSSRPPSPIKRMSGGIQVSDSLSRQASGGVIRKGGIESRIDVITRDYVPPAPKTDFKRSRSTPANRPREHGDRYIPARDVLNEDGIIKTFDSMTLNAVSASPSHTARLAEAVGLQLDKRILAFHEAPPPSAASKLMAEHREYARPLYARPGELASSTGAVTNKTRKIPTQPERVLDAPGMVDDFYLNLLAWSSLNVVAVALTENTYIWKADTGDVVLVGEAPEGSYVSSVDFAADGGFLGIGMGTGDVELWDVESNTKLRSMSGHLGQIAALSWNGHILSSACGDGTIWHHDVRIARHKVAELVGHTGEVCGLKWRADGELLASGGNDNVVNIWDARMSISGIVGGSSEATRGGAKWTKRSHTAAVKALAWCPWQTSLLATGGGTNDATINVWNSTTGARLHTQKTPSQVTSMHWSPHRKELMSTHGYPTNSIMLHAYPSFDKVAEIRDAHECRVLFSALGPAGDVVVTGAGDENLKFWRIWGQEVTAGTKKKKGVKENDAGIYSGAGDYLWGEGVPKANRNTRSGVLTIR